MRAGLSWAQSSIPGAQAAEREEGWRTEGRSNAGAGCTWGCSGPVVITYKVRIFSSRGAALFLKFLTSGNLLSRSFQIRCQRGDQADVGFLF